MPFTAIQSLDTMPDRRKVLVVGRDAIEAKDSTSTRLAVLASEGRAVIVLDQTNPLKYQAIPAEMELAPRTKKSDFGDEVPTAEGRTAFIEDTSHPALRGLKDKDFFTWGPDHCGLPQCLRETDARRQEPVQCGPRLRNTRRWSRCRSARA